MFDFYFGSKEEIAKNEGKFLLNCRPFYQEAGELLKSGWSTVAKIEDSYKPACRNDIFFTYFNADREIMNAAGMEKLGALEHRFDAWQVSGRRSNNGGGKRA